MFDRGENSSRLCDSREPTVVADAGQPRFEVMAVDCDVDVVDEIIC